MSLLKKVKKVGKGLVKGLTKPQGLIGLALAPVDPLTSSALVGSSVFKQMTRGNAKVNTSEAQNILSESEQNAKRARARILATSGGILGEEVDSVQKSGRNIFGN